MFQFGGLEALFEG